MLGKGGGVGADAVLMAVRVMVVVVAMAVAVVLVGEDDVDVVEDVCREAGGRGGVHVVRCGHLDLAAKEAKERKKGGDKIRRREAPAGPRA